MKTSSLEVLFAQAAQGRAFLLMLVCGALLGGFIHLTGRLHRVSRSAGYAADALCAGLLTLALGQVVLWTGQLRLYALLGLCIGLALYLGGVTPLTAFVAQLMQKISPRRQE